MISFNKVIKIKREALHLSQNDFGELVGVTGSTISAFEQGKTVSEVIVKQIKSTMKELEDTLSKEEYYSYRIVTESNMLIHETNQDQISERLDRIMYACLNLRNTKRQRPNNTIKNKYKK